MGKTKTGRGQEGKWKSGGKWKERDLERQIFHVPVARNLIMYPDFKYGRHSCVEHVAYLFAYHPNQNTFIRKSRFFVSLNTLKILELPRIAESYF